MKAGSNCNEGTRKRTWFGQGFVSAAAAAALMVGTAAQAGFAGRGREDVVPDTDTRWCRRGDGESCLLSELADPVRYRQILVYPSGYTQAELGAFQRDYAALLASMSAPEGETVYSRRYRDRLLYVAEFVPGGDLGESDAAFGGRIAPHPIRGLALSVDQSAVVARTDAMVAQDGYEPLGVILLFDSDEIVTANAAPPGFLGRNYGIARATRADLAGAYVPAHELAHGALNFLDEYIEGGFGSVSIRLLDLLSPLAVNDGSWNGFKRGVSDFFGVFDYRISEVLAANGSENIDTSMDPSRVSTEGYTPNVYEFEGGMFFGKGTFHDYGPNLMGFGYNLPEGDGFGWGHSASQESVIEQVFEHPDSASRPNDRLRNAGPLSGRWAATGRQTQVFLFDADKQHRFHPTLGWDLQVGWYERVRGRDRWRTWEKRVLPERNSIALPGSVLEEAANLLHGVVCMLNFAKAQDDTALTRICASRVEEMAGAFLPTLDFATPYQAVEIPIEQNFTKYYWRFRSDNGTWKSGWTGWSEVSRSF